MSVSEGGRGVGQRSAQFDVFVVASARTAIGTYGGALKDVTPAFLGEMVSRATIERARVEPTTIGQAVFGQVIQTEPADAYIARVVAVRAGVPHDATALTVNRLCGSGLQAILSAAQGLMLCDGEIALPGGVEVMSRAPYFTADMRWTSRMRSSWSEKASQRVKAVEAEVALSERPEHQQPRRLTDWLNPTGRGRPFIDRQSIPAKEPGDGLEGQSTKTRSAAT